MKIVLDKMICKCEDSDGDVCGKQMTQEEYDQDGMCSTCADNVWEEIEAAILGNEEHFWTHNKGDK